MHGQIPVEEFAFKECFRVAGTLHSYGVEKSTLSTIKWECTKSSLGEFLFILFYFLALILLCLIVFEVLRLI